MSKPAGDEHLGKWVYCTQHVRPHETGWCTVPPDMKFPLAATTQEEAVRETRANNWRIYGEEP